MTHCAKCNLTPWRGGLCYMHWRESQGFVFDIARKLFVKMEKKIA
jgi:hypothetical protein